MAPILTITIPTYGRYEQIQKQVRLILPQLTEQVELVVYDNCCPTQIASLFSNEELSKFRIVRNSVNVGADANIARCFEKCQSKWLWTLSDDDWVKSDAVQTMLNYINNNQDNTFTCFLGRKNMSLNSFDEFCNSLDTLITFSGAFTMSYCLYNMDRLKPYLRHYYENLTSMIGTLILVLKHGEENRNSKYCFSDIMLIDDYDPDVHWNYVKFIRQSEMLLYVMNPQKRNFYCKNVFKGLFLTDYYLISLNRTGSNIKKNSRFISFFRVLKKQGLFNALKHNPKVAIRLFAKLLIKHN